MLYRTKTKALKSHECDLNQSNLNKIRIHGLVPNKRGGNYNMPRLNSFTFVQMSLISYIISHSNNVKKLR